MDSSTIGQTVFSGLANGALYAFVGLGFGLVNRSTGIINFAQGEFVMLGAMFTAVLAESGLGIGMSALLAVILTAGVSGIFYVCAIAPARRATVAQLVLVTIGLSIFLRGAATTLWGAGPRPVLPFSGGRPISVAGVSVLPQELWLIATLIVVAIAIAYFFQRTMIGLAMRAGASNPLGATFLGIDHRRLGFYAFVLAGMLGALGGAVWSPIAFAQVDVGIGLGLKGFIAAALGGFATAYGPIGGGLLLGLLEAFGAGFLSSAYQDAITFTLLLVVLIVRPQGLLGTSASPTMAERPEGIPLNSTQGTHLAPQDAYRFIVGVVVLVACGQILNGVWLTTAIFALILAIVVMGLVLLTGYCGQLSLGQGAFMIIGAYSSGYLTLRVGVPPIAAMAIGALLASVVAVLLGKVIFRLHGYYLSMASLALLMIALTFAREWTSITGGANGLPGIPPFSFAGITVIHDRDFYYLALGVSLFVYALAFSITHSRYGRTLLASRSSVSAASACGVDVGRVKLESLTFSAAVASIAGSLYVHYLSIANPLPFGIEATIIQLTALTLGGLVSLWGAYIGSGIVTALPAVIVWLGGSATTQVVAGLQYLTFGFLLMAIVVLQSSPSVAVAWQNLRSRLSSPRALSEARSP